MPMFHVEHWVFAAFSSTGKDYLHCGQSCEVYKVELRFASKPTSRCYPIPAVATRSSTASVTRPTV